MMKVFISHDSPFLTTDTRSKRWAVPYNPECVNGRIGVLLDDNRLLLQNQSILDIGSHTGIFSLAALQLGAKFVHGIDVEERTIKRCMDLFSNRKDSTFRADSNRGSALGMRTPRRAFRIPPEDGD